MNSFVNTLEENLPNLLEIAKNVLQHIDKQSAASMLGVGVDVIEAILTKDTSKISTADVLEILTGITNLSSTKNDQELG